MTLCTIDQEKSFAERHKPLADEALKALEAAHSKLLTSSEYAAFEEQVKIFWRLLDEAPDSECCKVIAQKPELDEAFAECFSKTEFLLRCYRPLSQHVRNPTYSLLQDDDTEFMSAGHIVAEVDKALDEYRAFCGRSEKHEESRRYRALCAIYIAPAYVHRYEVAEYEKISDSELCFDIIIATARLTAILFGAHFPDDLTPKNLSVYGLSSRIGRCGNQRHDAYSVF